MANGNPFYVQPGNQFGQGLSSLAGSVQQFGQEQRQRSRQEAAREAFQSAVQSRDPNKMMEVVSQFPELSEHMQGVFGFTNDQTRRIAGETYRRALTDPQNAEQILSEGIEAVSAAGGRPEMMTRDLEALRRNPEAALQSMRVGFAGIAPEEYKALASGAEGGPNFGSVNPRDFTPESLAKFQTTGDYADLVRYEPKQSIDIGGVPHVFDRRVGGYVPASVSRRGRPSPGQAGTSPQEGQPEEVTAEDVGASRATITAAEEKAKLESELAKQGLRMTPEGNIEPIPGGEPAMEREQRQAAREKQKQQAFQKTRTVIRKVDDALEQVDWTSTGAIGQVTSILGGTPAKDLQTNLDTIKANLGFDALQQMREASETGGALGQVTEKEIRFLQSTLESLDQAQSPQQLRKNLQNLKRGYQKTERLLRGEIDVVESESDFESLQEGDEYIRADDPAREVQVKGRAEVEINNMTLKDLENLNPQDLTEEELRRAARRYDQLQGGQ